MLKVLDLFSGIGGFSLGLERTGGFETVAFCEIDPFCRKVLAKHWPSVPCFESVTDNEHTEQQADIITAGFPCQDISFAGAGAGLAGTRSGLWREVVRAVRLVRPSLALVENVAALLARGMGKVLGDLAEIGYDTEWDCIPAVAIGAPHIRDRVWVVANNRSQRGQGSFPEAVSQQPTFSWCENVRGASQLPRRSELYPSQLCRGGNGVSKRLDACGNAVVSQIPEIIGNTILQAEKEMKEAGV